VKLNLYYVCDKEGYLKEKITAHTLLNEIQPDGSHGWTLKYLDGKLNHRLELDKEMFCHEDCWVDPDDKFSDKIREGREEEFEFFLKHGYHMPMNTERDARK
jgi:hypothetical protein|tara:strand:+ start:1356 stop:1661 length:306 start_codon:yes stop_codon:yes gene_type:complete